MEVWFMWLARLMFLGIFLMAGGMLFRVWAIAVRKDDRYVADWRGRKIGDGRTWATTVLAVNVFCGVGLLGVGVSVLLLGLELTTWMGLAAFVLWTYYFLLQLASQRAKRLSP
ncbi:hypothetical protein SCD_n00477 [Sulfuricella denitrificans skB26]|uniref:Transmembrane protein n=1 Tax=Sulfuricella denitrificans (strain DSM 22764 / NBRC 105220 / skB26) TaxID=1163617 RepID=S6A9L6_SULDS|nr:hypothetical protein [Sulfuricella denitrificans]BAN34325.1 hypothetical protein SCD_n00477 [Sulfuricella denitrificans skB26]